MVQGERSTRPATIVDVAEAAGVSAMTVSRFLRGDRVKAADRIEEAVDALAFRPSEAARSLRYGRTLTVALVVPDITNPYFAAVVRGVESVARASDYTVVLANSDEDRDRERQALDALMGRVDGVILAPVDETDSNGDTVVAAGLPLVHLDRATVRGEAPDSVLVDNVGGARRAVEHLVGLGHRRIGTIAGPEGSTPGRERLEGFLEGMRAAGLEVPADHVERSDFRESGGDTAMARLWRTTPRPTAVLVANNQMTLGALGWLRRNGVLVPAELSVVGFDDHTFAELLDPPLTVIDRPMEEQGAEAMRLLLERLAGETTASPRRIVLPTTLVERRSCAPPSEEP
jgi:LacI family transcriptional regulator